MFASSDDPEGLALMCFALFLLGAEFRWVLPPPVRTCLVEYLVPLLPIFRVSVPKMHHGYLFRRRYDAFRLCSLRSGLALLNDLTSLLDDGRIPQPYCSFGTTAILRMVEAMSLDVPIPLGLPGKGCTKRGWK